MEKIGIGDVTLVSPLEPRRQDPGSHQDLPLMKSLGVVALNYSPLCQGKKTHQSKSGSATENQGQHAGKESTLRS